MKSPVRFRLAALFFVIVGGLLQSTSVISVAGVKPNLALVILVTIGLLAPALPYFLVLTLLMAIILKAFLASWISIGILSGLGLLAFVVRNYLPGKALMNNILFVTLATFALYAITDFKFFTSDWMTVTIEALYNIVLGIILCISFARIGNHEKTFRSSI